MKGTQAIIGVIIVVIVAAISYYLAKSSNASTGVASTLQPTTLQSSTIGSSSGSSTAQSTISSSTSTIRQGNSSSYTVTVQQSSSLGSYLANASGFTLYYYKSDKQNSGTSNCTGGCISSWPVFYTAMLNVPGSLSASNFNTIIRGDGMKQLTYNGYPLYYFQGDQKPGQANGNNVGGFAVASTSQAH